MKRSLFSFSMLALLVGTQAAAWGLTVRVQGAKALPGDTPDVCVYLDQNDGTVSGLQVDLYWDSSCLSVDRSSGDQAACVMNPETGRSTFQTRVLGSDRMRALMVNLSDPSPMPPTVSQLFCCQFRVSAAAEGRTCGVTPSNIVLSDRQGQRLPFTAVGGSITVARGSDERGLGSGGMGPGGVMAPGAVQGGSTGGATTGGTGAPGEGGPAIAPAAPVRGGAPAGAPPAPAVAPAPMVPPPAQGAPAGGGEESVSTPEAVVATPEATLAPTPAATPEITKPTAAPTRLDQATPEKKPDKVGTTTPEMKKSPPVGTPTAATAARTPQKKPKARKSPTPR